MKNKYTINNKFTMNLKRFVFVVFIFFSLNSFGQLVVPYTQTFESIVLANALPANWARTGTASDQPTYLAAPGSYNRTNHTGGGAKFASFYYTTGAGKLYSFGTFNLVAGTTYDFSTWYITDGNSGWTTLSLTYGTGTTIALQPNVIASVSSPVNTTYSQLSGTFTPAVSGTYYLGIKCVNTASPWYLTIDDISVTALAACAGTPTAGNTAATPSTVCANAAVNLSVTGVSTTSGLTYQWQSSPDNATWSNIIGATSATYIANPAVTTWYRRTITCTNSGLSANSVSIQVLIDNYLCYCTSNATSTSDEEILNVTFGTLNNSSTCATTGGTGSILNEYSNYTAIAAPNVMQTSTVPFSVQVGTCGGTFSNGVAIWIDYNQDGDFADAGEKVYFSAATTSGAHTESGNIVIPVTATVGTTIMRVIVTEFSVPSNPCGTYSYGETEDYKINITAAAACSGTPTPGNAAATPNPVCSGSPVTLSVTGATSGVTGLTYQWQSSTDNITWTDIPGANTPTFVVNPVSNTYYRRIITCAASATSTSVYVTMGITASCYCVSAATSTTDMDIGNVTFGTINNTSACSSLTGTQGTAIGTASMYSNFWGTTVPIPSVAQGSTVPISVTIPTCGTAYSHRVDVYIDFNQNGLLTDAGESFAIFAYANPGAHTVNYNIPIPITATLGNTLMRVVVVESSTASPCGTYTWGETEDYQINIIVAPACAGVPVGGTTTSTVNPVCSTTTFTLSVTGSSSNSGLTYQWQSSPDNVTWTNIPGATSFDLTITQAAATYYRRVVTCTASGSSANSSSLQITMSTDLASCYCASAASFSSYEDISNVTFGTINNTSVCASLTGTQGVATGTADLYSNFTNTTPVPSVQQGTTVPLAVTITQCTGSAWSHQVNVYIDFNRNGVLTDAGEAFVIYPYTSFNTHTINYNVPIPITASVGNTLMRIVCKESSTIGPCLVSSYGETEDYKINITLAPPCAGAPAGGTAATSLTTVCPTTTIFLSITGSALASGLTYQWQSSPTALGPWTNIAGATSATLTISQAANTYYRRITTCTASGLTGTSSSVLVSMDTPANCAISCGNPANNDWCSNPATLTQGPFNWSSTTDPLYSADNPGDLSFCGSIENNSWYQFVATATTATFNFTSVINCANGWGIQAEVFSIVHDGTGCCTNFTSMSNCLNDMIPQPGTVTATGLTIGQTYVLMVDGYAGDNCDFTVSGWSATGILPIELTNFEAICKGNKVNLVWTTASEINNDYFTIEKSADGKNFEIVSTIKGVGNSNSMMHYTYTDYEAPKGLSYYRLKQTDFNGAFTYSNVHSVKCTDISTSVNYFPNPFTNEITIKVNNLTSSNANIEVIDMIGKTILSKKFENIQNDNSEFKIDVSGIAAGTYFIRFKSDTFNDVSKVFKN